MRSSVVFILLIMVGSSCMLKKIPVDLIVSNARVYTVDTAFTMVESFCVSNGKIIATGSSEEIKRRYTSDNFLDLSGRFVYPGLIDAHCHFTGYGLSLMHADLTGTASFEEVVSVLKKHHEKVSSEWVLGRGWDQNDWAVKEFPDRQLLDQAFPLNPVLIIRIDGHAAVANQKALEVAGISGTTRVAGGSLLEKNGRLTGVLIDNAIDLVRRMVPEPGKEETQRALIMAQENCFAVGLTGVHEAGLDYASIRMIDSLQKAGVLRMRIYAMITPDRDNLENFMYKGIYETPYLNIRSVKLFADGALGSRGALMRSPYFDDPGNRGLLVTPLEKLKKICIQAYQIGYQVNTHCIGDSANRLILRLYGSVLKRPHDRRWRIEHAQVVDPHDLPLFREYSVIPSVQPAHATSDMSWAADRLGKERMGHAYALRKLLEQNGYLAAGSDFPVEHINPFYRFYAAVVRKDLKGAPPEGFQTDDALSRKEALRAMTIWAARAAFEEHKKGSIEKDKYADFIVTDEDLMETAPEKLPFIRVLATYIAGKEVYRRE